MRSEHFYITTLSFALGIFWQSFYDLNWSVMVWLLVVAVGICAVSRTRSFASWPAYLIIFLSCLSFGLWRFDLANSEAFNEDYETQLGQEVNLIGVVVREPEIRDRTTQLYVKVEDELILVSADRYYEFAYGDKIEFRGELQKPEAFATDLGRTFDYPNYLLARGVAYTVSFAKVEIKERGQGNQILSKLYQGKQNFLTTLESLLVEPEVGLAEGLLLGVKRAIGEELETIFRQTGIIHIVVLSGYNIMIVVTFVMYLLSRFLNQKWQVICGVLAIIIFAILVGLSATVVRASIMASLLLVMSLTGRTYIALRGLFLAGAVMLLINPYLLAFDTGFQLSFLATLGLILVSPILLTRVQFVPTLIGIREFLVATLATQIMVLPLLLFSIGEFSLVAVIVNVLVLPLVPIAMLLTFITGLVGTFSIPLALPLAYLAHSSLTYIIGVATWFSKLPLASVAVPAFSFWLVPLAYLAIFYAVYRWQNRAKITETGITDELTGWTIEEETETLPSPSSVTEPNTPIFFR